MNYSERPDGSGVEVSGIPPSDDKPAPMLAALGVLVFGAVIFVFSWVSNVTSGWPECPLTKRFGSPGIALQFAQTEAELSTLLEPSDCSGYDKTLQMEQGLKRDFLLMAAYGSLHMVFAGLFAGSSKRWSHGMACVIAFCAISAASADGWENFICFQILGAEEGERAAFLATLHFAVYTKWTLLFAATALLGWLPIARSTAFCLSAKHKKLGRWMPCFFCLAAGISCFGLIEPTYFTSTVCATLIAWTMIVVLLARSVVLALWRKLFPVPRAD